MFLFSVVRRIFTSVFVEFFFFWRLALKVHLNTYHKKWKGWWSLDIGTEIIIAFIVICAGLGLVQFKNWPNVSCEVRMNTINLKQFCFSNCCELQSAVKLWNKCIFFTQFTLYKNTKFLIFIAEFLNNRRTWWRHQSWRSKVIVNLFKFIKKWVL